MSNSGALLKTAPKNRPPPFAAPIVGGRTRAADLLVGEGRTRAVVVAFQLLESGLAVRLSFPLFLSNALDWLRDDGTDGRGP